MDGGNLRSVWAVLIAVAGLVAFSGCGSTSNRSAVEHRVQRELGGSDVDRVNCRHTPAFGDGWKCAFRQHASGEQGYCRVSPHSRAANSNMCAIPVGDAGTAEIASPH